MSLSITVTAQNVKYMYVLVAFGDCGVKRSGTVVLEITRRNGGGRRQKSTFYFHYDLTCVNYCYFRWR